MAFRGTLLFNVRSFFYLHNLKKNVSSFHYCRFNSFIILKGREKRNPVLIICKNYHSLMKLVLNKVVKKVFLVTSFVFTKSEYSGHGTRKTWGKRALE